MGPNPETTTAVRLSDWAKVYTYRSQPPETTCASAFLLKTVLEWQPTNTFELYESGHLFPDSCIC